MSEAKEHARIYREAAQANIECPFLHGSTIHLPDYGQAVITGDIHGHRRNFERIVTYCDLEHAAVRHVLLQELIHEEPADMTAFDMSHELLLEAARWKLEFPDQVHFLQSNHELAQLIGQEITKGGRLVTQGFIDGIIESYGADADCVVDAINEFLRTYALVAKTKNRIMVSHSLPSPAMMPMLDPDIINRLPEDRDLLDGGSVYVMVWGRRQTAEQIATLSGIFDVDYFICGHQPQENGYAIEHDRQVVIASDHNHGTYLPLDLKRAYDIDDLEAAIKPLVAIA